MRTRAEHLAWCKSRALEILDGAVASMISDLQKFSEPLYDPLTFVTLSTDGMMFRRTPSEVRNWIEGFA